MSGEVEAFCAQRFGRFPGLPEPAVTFNLTGVFAATTIIPALAGRFIFVDRLVMQVSATGTFHFQTDSGVNLYGTAALPASALGSVQHIFERILWTELAGLAIQMASASAGSTFNGRISFRYV